MRDKGLQESTLPEEDYTFIACIEVVAFLSMGWGSP